MKLTEQQQNRIKRCVDNLIDEQTGMDKDQLFGFCTNLEKAGKLDETGHWGKDRAKFAEMIGLPVFKAGVYHDGKVTVTEADLDEIAANFTATADAFKRPVKLTHKDEKNDQNAAMGYIRKVYTAAVDGVKHLLADLSDVPDTLSKAIVDRRVLDRSIEMYPTFQGKRNVLRALAFLGDDVPEVKGLPDLKNYVYGENEPEHVTIFYSEAVPGGSGQGSTQSTDSINNGEKKPMETIKLTINGQVMEFADANAVKAHFTTGLVPASELETLKKRAADAEAENRKYAVKLAFAEFRKPNDKGKVIAPAVVDSAEKLATSLPVEVKFSEADGKEITGVEMLKGILKTFSETGLVDVTPDKTKASDPTVATADTELKTVFEENKASGIIRADMTFEQFKAAQGVK
jgi:hypothetical protein